MHPEAYSLVKNIAEKNQKNIKELIGNGDFLKRLHAADYIDEHFGLPTVRDIIKELDKPGRDPRPEFQTATFAEGVNEISDLEPGMVLEGVVSNVANFGAFVDIGVHQDGLVHISALTNKYVADPREVVKAGDIVKVKVMEVDVKRKRIGLSMRLDDEIGQSSPSRKPDNRSPRNQQRKQQAPQNSAMGGAFAQAFAKAKK